jgi:hypothetical protein
MRLKVAVYFPVSNRADANSGFDRLGFDTPLFSERPTMATDAEAEAEAEVKSASAR